MCLCSLLGVCLLPSVARTEGFALARNGSSTVPQHHDGNVGRSGDLECRRWQCEGSQQRAMLPWQGAKHRSASSCMHSFYDVACGISHTLSALKSTSLDSVSVFSCTFSSSLELRLPLGRVPVCIGSLQVNGAQCLMHLWPCTWVRSLISSDMVWSMHVA